MSDPQGHAGNYNPGNMQGANGWRQGTYHTQNGAGGHHDNLQHRYSEPIPQMSPDLAGQGSRDVGTASHQHLHHANTIPKPATKVEKVWVARRAPAPAQSDFAGPLNQDEIQMIERNNSMEMVVGRAVPGAAPQGQQQPPAMRSDAHIILSGVQASETNHAAIHAIVTAPQPTGPPADLLKPDIHGGSILISIPKPEQYSEDDFREAMYYVLHKLEARFPGKGAMLQLHGQLYAVDEPHRSLDGSHFCALPIRQTLPPPYLILPQVAEIGVQILKGRGRCVVVRGDYLGTETELPPAPPKFTPTPELTLRCLTPGVWQAVRLRLLWVSRKVAVFAVPTAFNSYGNENVTMRLGRGAAFAPDVIVKAAWLQPTRGWDQVAPHLGAGCPSRETDDKHLAAELKNLSMQNQAHGSYRQTS